jgi:hypothetical protein
MERNFNPKEEMDIVIAALKNVVCSLRAGVY